MRRGLRLAVALGRDRLGAAQGRNMLLSHLACSADASWHCRPHFTDITIYWVRTADAVAVLAPPASPLAGAPSSTSRRR